jgi:hypothetical protein
VRLRGVLSGLLSLIVLETVLSSDASASRLGSAGTVIASLIRRAVSPAVPLVPDLRGHKSAPAPASAPAGLTTTRPTTAPVPSHVVSV